MEEYPSLECNILWSWRLVACRKIGPNFCRTSEWFLSPDPWYLQNVWPLLGSLFRFQFRILWKHVSSQVFLGQALSLNTILSLQLNTAASINSRKWYNLFCVWLTFVKLSLKGEKEKQNKRVGKNIPLTQSFDIFLTPVGFKTPLWVKGFPFAKRWVHYYTEMKWRIAWKDPFQDILTMSSQTSWQQKLKGKGWEWYGSQVAMLRGQLKKIITMREKNGKKGLMANNTPFRPLERSRLRDGAFIFCTRKKERK